MHGQYTWYELTTPDVGAAKKFYPKLTGWGTQAFDKDYTMFTTGGAPVAGIFRLTDELKKQGVPPNWMPYVESSNVDESASKAASLGAKIVHGPTDVPGAGRFAVVQDPQGAVFGIYKSSGTSSSWDGTPVVGRFSWHELMTTDYAKAFEFYKALFGWEMTGQMDMGGGNMYSMYGQNGKAYGGMFNITPDMAGMHPFWLLYVHVPDVAQGVATATKNGAKVIRPQIPIPGGTIAILGDPQGAGIALHDMKTMPAEMPAAKTAASPPAKPAAKAVPKKAAKPAAKKTAKPIAKKAAKLAKKKAAKPAAKRTAKKATKSKAGSRPKAKGKARTKPAARKKARKR